MNPNFQTMTIEQLLTYLGLVRGRDTTRDTYLYIADDGSLTAIEKPDHRSDPADQAEMIGYVAAFSTAR